jgi:hypothetical protein
VIVGPVSLSEADTFPTRVRCRAGEFTAPRTAPAYEWGSVATPPAIWSCAECLNMPRMVPHGNWLGRPEKAGYCLEVWLSPRDPARSGANRLLVVFGVDERAAHALDELVSVMLVGEHLRGHMLAQHGLVVTSPHFRTSTLGSCAPLWVEMRHRQALVESSACLVVRLR